MMAIRRILVCSDLSERSDRAINRGLHLSKDLKAECHVVNVVDDSLPKDIANALQVKSLSTLEDQVAALNGDAHCSAIVGDPIVAIPEYASEISADLLVVGLHRPRAFLDSMMETTMERLVRFSRIPALLVRDPVANSYKRVLAMLSFSPACKTVLGASFSVKNGPEKIDAVHSIHIPYVGLTGDGPDSQIAEEFKAEAEETAKAWMSQLSEDYQKVDLSFTFDSPYVTVKTKTSERAYDFLALGAHTRTGVFNHGLGSFTADLIRHPPTDILIARP